MADSQIQHTVNHLSNSSQTDVCCLAISNVDFHLQPIIGVKNI